MPTSDTTMIPKWELNAAFAAATKGKHPVSEITCYWCSGKGHYKSDCPSPEKDAAALADEGVEDGIW